MPASPTFAGTPVTKGTPFVNGGATAQVIAFAGPNGARIHAATFSQNDTSTGSIQLYKGRILTDNAQPQVGWPPYQLGKGMPPVLSVATTTTITRSNGSFLQDGWQVGQQLLLLNHFDTPANQVINYLTTVVAGTLTLGTAITAATTPAAGLQIAQVDLLWAVAAVSAAGTGTTAQVNLLSTTYGSQLLPQPDTFLTLAPNELLIASIGTAVTSAKTQTISCEWANY